MKSCVFIGGGNMASCIVSGLYNTNTDRYRITVCDPNQVKLDLLKEKYKVEICLSNKEAVKNADLLILAVKPQSIRGVINEVKSFVKPSTIIISVAAGVKTTSIKSWLKKSNVIIRAMPNTPSAVLCGATGLYTNPETSEKTKNQVKEIFDAIGYSCWVDDEKDINAVIALSGSSPAYFFKIFEIMQGIGQELGLDEKKAFELLIQTFIGSSKMIRKMENTPAQLREQVTSPGGTTERALNVFNKGNLESTLREAMHKAYERAEEMSEDFSV